MGDFNYAGIDWEHMIIEGGRDAQLIHENALDNLLVQHVNFNTRHRVNNNPSRLDLIFTNEEEMIENITSEAPIGLSDHVGISFELVLSTNIIRQSQYLAYLCMQMIQHCSVILTTIAMKT